MVLICFSVMEEPERSFVKEGELALLLLLLLLQLRANQEPLGQKSFVLDQGFMQEATASASEPRCVSCFPSRLAAQLYARSQKAPSSFLSWTKVSYRMCITAVRNLIDGECISE